MTANRTKKIEDEAWELLDNAPEDSVLEGSSDLVHSSDSKRRGRRSLFGPSCHPPHPPSFMEKYFGNVFNTRKKIKKMLRLKRRYVY